MGEKKPNILSNKKFLLGIIIGCAAMAIVVLGIFLATRNDEEEIVTFSDYLENGNYTAAYKEYESANIHLYNPLNAYLTNIVNDYNNSVITYDEALSLLSQLKSSGFTIQEVEDAENNLSLLNASKESFNTANGLFNEGKQSDSREYFEAVMSEDTHYDMAQQKLAEIDAMVQSRIDSYNHADELYANNEIDEALAQYQLIVDSGVDTEHAINRIAKIEDVNRAWEAEFSEDNYSRCSYPYSTPVKNDFIYLPYSDNNVHSIIKYNLTDQTTEAFVLTKLVGPFIIKDINIIDNYLYFIAGESVGSGRMLDSPYSVYRMKDDGTDLERVASADYKNLIAYKDGFYAVSYTQGILRLDRNLKYVETICESVPDQTQLVEDKIYYTLAEYNYRRDMYNAMYVYDGQTTELLKKEIMLQFGFYSGIELDTFKAYEYYEKLFFINPAEDKNFLLKFDDIKQLYGLVGQNIVYTMERSNGKDDYYVYSRISQGEEKYTYKVPNHVTHLISVCIEKEILIFETQNGFAISDSNFNFIADIDLSTMQIHEMDITNDLSFANDPVYSEEEVVIVEDGFWYYSGSEYNVTIESKYIIDIDTNIYLAHIRTTDPVGIYIDSPADDTLVTQWRKNPRQLSRQMDAIIGCNGDFFDEPSNDWTGISIREGIVYKKRLLQDMVAIYPDGSIKCHSADENIRYEELLYAGVKDTLSFGPILLTEGEYGKDIYTNFLAGANPRCALGMVEPGHYVIILADGRQPNSAGITLKRLADLFLEAGCVEAYNLDGGQSAALMFMGEYVNTHEFDYTGSGFRAIGELVYFGTSDLVPDETP